MAQAPSFASGNGRPSSTSVFGQAVGPLPPGKGSTPLGAQTPRRQGTNPLPPSHRGNPPARHPTDSATARGCTIAIGPSVFYSCLMLGLFFNPASDTSVAFSQKPGGKEGDNTPLSQAAGLSQAAAAVLSQAAALFHSAAPLSQAAAALSQAVGLSQAAAAALSQAAELSLSALWWARPPSSTLEMAQAPSFASGNGRPSSTSVFGQAVGPLPPGKGSTPLCAQTPRRQGTNPLPPSHRGNPPARHPTNSATARGCTIAIGPSVFCSCLMLGLFFNPASDTSVAFSQKPGGKEGDNTLSFPVQGFI
ncbi:UNVERIFIED_CONTAM: hypothetical protein FKN15_069731 [Acipenser sinensis]